MSTSIEPSKNVWNFLIVAALREEIKAFDAVFQHDQCDVTKGRLAAPNDSSFTALTISLKMEQADRSYSGILASPGKIGTVGMSALVAYLLASNDFNIIVLAGLAAGMKDKGIRPQLGDVVMADAVVDVQGGKHFDGADINLEPGTDHIERRPVTILAREGIVRKMRVFAREPVSFHTWRAVSSDGSILGGGGVRCHIGTFLTTSRVVASSAETKRLAEIASRYPPYRMPLAVEMEGIGVAGAIDQISRSTQFAIIKAVNDYGDRYKSAAEAHWREVACYNSASAAWGFIKLFLAD